MMVVAAVIYATEMAVTIMLARFDYFILFAYPRTELRDTLIFIFF